MAFIVPFLPSIGATVAGLGAIQKANAEGDVLELNAKVARQNSTIAIQEGEADVRKLKRNQFKVLGAQRVAGFSGIANLSALDVMEETISESELDMQRRQYLAKLQARGFNVEADIAEFNADNVRASGVLQGASQFLLAGSKLP